MYVEDDDYTEQEISINKADEETLRSNVRRVPNETAMQIHECNNAQQLPNGSTEIQHLRKKTGER